MFGRLTHQLREAGLVQEAEELKAALRGGRRGLTTGVSRQTETAVVQALRRSGRFAPPPRDFRTRGFRGAMRSAMD
jgi:hypothetical protein